MSTQGENHTPLSLRRYTSSPSNKRIKLPKLEIDSVHIHDLEDQFRHSSLRQNADLFLESPSDTSTSANSPLRTPPDDHFTYAANNIHDCLLRRDSTPSISFGSLWSSELGPQRSLTTLSSPGSNRYRHSEPNPNEKKPRVSEELLTPTCDAAPHEYKFSQDQVKRLIREIHGVKYVHEDLPIPTSIREEDEAINVLGQLSVAKAKGLNQMKIIQWYCCQCGKSYGDLDHFVVERSQLENAGPNVSDDEYWNSIADELLSKTINRFDCNRCNHMMCPYCIKARLSDLLNK
ncbi:hypothetical protein KL923_002778 [Ogataea haglerorum]|nr:hypothetical protein KL923_002778 [Ogataea haglerorum]